MNYEEFLFLLKTAGTAREIDKYRTQIAQLIPQVVIMFGYDQKNQAHQHDLWMHSLHVVSGLPRNLDDDMLYLAALLHDIGKPDCRVPGKREDDPDMHYYAHPRRSREIVQNEVLPGLYEKGIYLPFEDQKRLLYYISCHDEHISLRMKSIRRHLQMVSLDEFKKLMLLQLADAEAHVQLPAIAKRVEICRKMAGEYANYLCGQIQAGR